MNSYKNYLLAGSGIVVLFGAFVLSVPGVAQGQGGEPVGPPKPVLVVNTSASPVPITGTLRDADHPARQPINVFAHCSALSGHDCSDVVYEVPQGKRLVIEYASMDAHLLGKSRGRSKEIQCVLVLNS